MLFHEKVKVLIKASWKYFMIEMQAEKGSQKPKSHCRSRTEARLRSRAVQVLDYDKH